jgi:hypothetical protein
MMHSMNRNLGPRNRTFVENCSVWVGGSLYMSIAGMRTMMRTADGRCRADAPFSDGPLPIRI